MAARRGYRALRQQDLCREAFGEEAQWRRDLLAFLVARELEPLTLEFQFPKKCPKDVQRLARELPGEAIANARLYLRGDSPFEDGTRQLEEMYHYDDNVTFYLKNGKWQCVFGGLVALLPRLGRADDEVYVGWNLYDRAATDKGHFEITEHSLGDDLHVIEVHCIAAMVAFYTDDDHCLELGEENIALQRRYWHGWMDRQVPRVLGPVEDVRASLD